MKKGLLATTALAGVSAVAIGGASAAEAPTWKLSGAMKFQFYWVDQDKWGDTSAFSWENSTDKSLFSANGDNTKIDIELSAFRNITVDNPDGQDHDWYLGLDDSEIQLNVNGAADNGLKYGFKIEIQTNTTSGTVADEARIQLAGNWGTIQLGDEDGAEDIMNYGGESLLGGAGAWDGDLGDVLYSRMKGNNVGDMSTVEINYSTPSDSWINVAEYYGDWNVKAPGSPTLAGDTSDATKISYFSPRFSGFQVGASVTPTPNNGDSFKADDDWEDHYGLGANYDNSFGNLHLQASMVYSMNSSTDTKVEDAGAYSVGGVVGWGPFSIGANYTDNGDSSQPLVYNSDTDAYGTVVETAYYDVAAGYKSGPMKFSLSYFSSWAEVSIPTIDDSTFEVISLTGDYKVAPGLTFYAEIDMISEELIGGTHITSPYVARTDEASLTNDTTLFILGTKVSF